MTRRKLDLATSFVDAFKKHKGGSYIPPDVELGSARLTPEELNRLYLEHERNHNEYLRAYAAANRVERMDLGGIVWGIVLTGYAIGALILAYYARS